MVKQLLTKAPILVPRTDGESLPLYIAATMHMVSATLVVELMYTILIIKRKLRHYFESHPVTVVTSSPLA